ncbi:ABC1 kinase family protein [Alkanindiges sp. WGS2144]|uniref:ABC1 kinase family protein n=1 Tax=Alkanindiges sp. WGS2144 TaxID=3366808 RepID=UPI00375044C2
MAEKISTPGRRFMKLAGMTASIAGRAVSNSIKSINANEEEKLAAKSKLYEDIGVKIAETLGEMKGAVMKVGQIASQYKDIFPPEVANAIAKLQRQAPAVPFSTIQYQIEREMGKPLEQIFASIETEPFAAASIGQVHRAILPTGERVVVKVQYPGVDEACESDLKQVRLALRLAGVFKIDKKLQDQLFNEMQDSLTAELNYQIEAHNLQVFATFHQPLDSKVIIPKVYPEYSTRRVLTLSEELGEPVETAATWTQELRNELGQRLFRLISQEIFYLHSFHTDPHPGNFAFRPDGAVVVYDYGSTKTLRPEIVATCKQLVKAAFASDIPTLEQELRKLHIRNHNGQIPAEFYQQWIDILTRPLNGEYDFAQNTAHHEAVALAKKSLKYWDCFQPSAETMMLNRTISGQYWNMINLKVKDNFRPSLEEIVPLQSTTSPN